MLYSGDALLFNQYAYLPISKARFPHVKSELTKKIEDWLSGPKGQELIRNYKLNGQGLFVPNATRAGSDNG